MSLTTYMDHNVENNPVIDRDDKHLWCGKIILSLKEMPNTNMDNNLVMAYDINNNNAISY